MRKRKTTTQKHKSNDHITTNLIHEKKTPLLLVIVDALGFIGYNHHEAIENPKKFVLDQNSTIKKHNSKWIIEFR